MSLRINNNVEALNAHRHLLNNEKMLTKSLERLSSAQKINRGADGPAALVISEGMRSPVLWCTACSRSTTSVERSQCSSLPPKRGSNAHAIDERGRTSRQARRAFEVWSAYSCEGSSTKSRITDVPERRS